MNDFGYRVALSELSLLYGTVDGGGGIGRPHKALTNENPNQSKNPSGQP